MSDELLHVGCLHQARKNPSAMAVICGGERLSYGELVRRASQVAVELKANGVGPEVVVGVLADRSVEAAIGILSVLLAGGAYLPLEPGQPDDRLRILLDDANAKAVLCGPNLESRIASNAVKKFSIGLFSNQITASENILSIASTNDPRSLAYVIFTSGSTGRPKGVMIEHRGAANTVCDVNERFGVGGSDRVLCLSSFGFDLSVYDLFGIWAAGGAVIIPTTREANDPSAWLRLIQDHHITIWNSVPALLEVLVNYAEALHSQVAAQLASIRLVMLSGDWIPVTLPNRFRRLQPNSEVVSLGGATEASIWSVIYSIRNIESTWKSIPYGKAMRGQSIYVLDETLSECPPGIVGEIYIGGSGVARGYVGRTDLTEQQFLPHPFSSNDSVRLYKTGDLGRLFPDRNIEFLGRADGQVKINGHRIELGEIESTLTRHPLVREAAVVAATSAANRRRLVAFVVTDRRAVSPDELRSFLSGQLPAYMLPAQIHLLTSLPLTANGKVDRNQLLDDASCPHTDSRIELGVGGREELLAPKTYSRLEADLREIWNATFERHDIGPTDDFFDLGGDSLIAIILSAKIQRHFGRDVTIADVIAFPTIRQLAMFLEDERTGDRQDGSIEINRGNSGPPLFFVPPIAGDLFGMRELALRLPPELPIIGLQPRGILNGQMPDRTIAAIASYYLEQVRRCQPQGPYHLVGFSLGGTIAFEMANILLESEDQPPLLIMIDAPRHGRNRIVRAGLQVSNLISRSFTQWIKRQTVTKSEPDIPQSVATIYEAHHSALCHYRPRTYPSKAHWLRTSQRDGVIKRVIDDVLGTWDWRVQLPNSPIPDWIMGSHTSLFEQPNVDDLAARLLKILQTTPSLHTGRKLFAGFSNISSTSQLLFSADPNDTVLVGDPNSK